MFADDEVMPRHMPLGWLQRGFAFEPGAPTGARAALNLARAVERAGEACSTERGFRYELELAPAFHDARHDLVVLLSACGRRAEAADEWARIPAGVLDAQRGAKLLSLLGELSLGNGVE